MTQNRPPPAFQEYAAPMLANRDFRVMSLAERGLLWTIRLECWVNHTLPADPAMLGRVLGVNAEEVTNALPAISPFILINEGSISCPELDDYRQHLLGQRQKQSDGGKKGAARTNGKRKSPETEADRAFGGGSGNSSGYSRDNSRVLSSVQSSSVKPSKTQPLERGVTSDPWVSDYEAASNGR